jgi:hypothetical protein
MADGNCIHNWCERLGHDMEADVHESTSVGVPGLCNTSVSTQVSYRDGDREPLIYVSAGDAELTTDGLEQLINNLREQLLIMRAVQRTPALVLA